MRKKVHTLLGYTLPQIVMMAAVSIAAAWLAGVLVGLVVVAVLPGVIVVKNHYSRRSEAAWEITENGTHELWNDRPKPPVKGGILIDRQ